MKNLISKIIAHRGASFEAPENTIHSIELAWEQGIQKVEVDIHLTKDNKIAVIHDKNTLKLSGKNLFVKEESLETLQKIDVGSWKGKKWKHTKIPRLEEVVNTIPSFGTLIIEVKCGLEIIPFLLNSIKEIPTHQIEFISFDYKVISKLKKEAPQYKALWLLDLDYTPETKENCSPLDTYIQKAIAANLDGLNLWVGDIANKEYIQTIKRNNLLVYIWSTNSLTTAKHFLDLHVDAITTDRPFWLLTKLEQLNND